MTHSTVHILITGYYSFTELYERGLLTKPEISEMRQYGGKRSPLALLWALEDLTAHYQKSVHAAAAAADSDAPPLQQQKLHQTALLEQAVFLKIQDQILATRTKFGELAIMRRVQVPVIYTHMLW
jgi:hypothetical protein